jgi:carboxypeptidase Taq
MTTATSVRPEVAALRVYAEEVDAIRSALSLLGWDQKTKLPRKGHADRGRQLGVLAGIVHERSTSPELERLIAAVEDADPDNVEARVMRRDFDLSTKLPGEHVIEYTQAAAAANEAWEQAREDDDFASYQPHLERVLDLARKTADLYGYETEPYDALHDLYEEGSTAAELAPLFEQLREPINTLIDRQPEADTSVLSRTYPLQAQVEYARHIAIAIGFDMDAGRIDETVHPFCSGIGVNDTRLTTRYQADWLPASLFSVIHEGGHGIYNQSFDRLGLPATIGEAPGLGMHESQSRMYENAIGRSRAFWEFEYANLQRTFPDALGDVDLDLFVRQINTAQRSLIRVEADELTYNLHVAVRFELERAMVNGELKVADLPEAWNAGYERWLGLRPPNDADGCLQDVHWTSSFGYFPTYTLGNIYAAQFVEKCEQDIGSLDDHLRRGEVLPVRNWFDEHVYQYGRTYTGREFVERVTGGPISVVPLLRYLERKFG